MNKWKNVSVINYREKTATREILFFHLDKIDNFLLQHNRYNLKGKEKLITVKNGIEK